MQRPGDAGRPQSLKVVARSHRHSDIETLTAPPRLRHSVSDARDCCGVGTEREDPVIARCPADRATSRARGAKPQWNPRLLQRTRQRVDSLSDHRTSVTHDVACPQVCQPSRAFVEHITEAPSGAVLPNLVRNGSGASATRDQAMDSPQPVWVLYSP